MIKFRCETGCIRNGTLQERCCVLCKGGLFEDQKHFFLIAIFFENNRNSPFHCVNLDRYLDARYLNLNYTVRQNCPYKSA